MTGNFKRIIYNKILLYYASCFLLLSYLFGFLWAIVLLITVELLEDNYKWDRFLQLENFFSLSDNRKEEYCKKYSFNKSSDICTNPIVNFQTSKPNSSGMFPGERKQQRNGFLESSHNNGNFLYLNTVNYFT